MKIIHEKYKCIGCRACVRVCPEYFEMADDGKASLKGSKKKDQEGGETEVRLIKEAGCARNAADICPVSCIELKNEG